MLGLYQVKWLSDEYAHKTIYFCVKSCTSDLLGWKRQLINNGLPAELLWSWCVPHRQWVAVASAGPCASLHLAADRQPHQNPTILFFYRPDALPATQPTASKHCTVCTSMWIFCVNDNSSEHIVWLVFCACRKYWRRCTLWTWILANLFHWAQPKRKYRDVWIHCHYTLCVEQRNTRGLLTFYLLSTCICSEDRNYSYTGTGIRGL